MFELLSAVLAILYLAATLYLLFAIRVTVQRGFNEVISGLEAIADRLER